MIPATAAWQRRDSHQFLLALRAALSFLAPCDSRSSSRPQGALDVALSVPQCPRLRDHLEVPLAGAGSPLGSRKAPSKSPPRGLATGALSVKTRTGRDYREGVESKNAKPEPVRDNGDRGLRRHFHQWAAPHGGNLTPPRTAVRSGHACLRWARCARCLCAAGTERPGCRLRGADDEHDARKCAFCGGGGAAKFAGSVSGGDKLVSLRQSAIGEISAFCLALTIHALADRRSDPREGGDRSARHHACTSSKYNLVNLGPNRVRIS